MIIDLPVVYDAEIIPKGCRKSQHVKLASMETFEIEEPIFHNVIKDVVNFNYVPTTALNRYKKEEQFFCFDGILYKKTIANDFYVNNIELSHNSQHYLKLDNVKNDLSTVILKSLNQNVTHGYNNLTGLNANGLIMNLYHEKNSIFSLKDTDFIKTLISDNKNQKIVIMQNALKECFVYNNDLFFKKQTYNFSFKTLQQDFIINYSNELSGNLYFPIKDIHIMMKFIGKINHYINEKIGKYNAFHNGIKKIHIPFKENLNVKTHVLNNLIFDNDLFLNYIVEKLSYNFVFPISLINQKLYENINLRNNLIESLKTDLSMDTIILLYEQYNKMKNTLFENNIKNISEKDLYEIFCADFLLDSILTPIKKDVLLETDREINIFFQKDIAEEQNNVSISNWKL